jgi:ATP-dependent DNA ligase
MNYDNLFNELASDNSRLFKEALLTKHKDDMILKQIIVLALDPFTQFGIRKIPSYTPNTTEHAASIVFGLKELLVLSSREKTGNSGIEHLSNLLSAVSDHAAKVLIRIIEKDLRCGVSAATVNKIWPNLIAEYPVMLASGFDEKLVCKMDWPAYAQLKLDGMRANVIVKDGKVEVRSRNGKEVHVHGHFDFFADLAKGKNLVFDGELMVKNDDGRFLDRKTGNGILNQCVKGTIEPNDTANIHIVLYDIIDYNAFVVGKSDIKYIDRYQQLTDVCFGVNASCSLVLNRIVNNLEQAQEVFQEYYAMGEEGIILKNLNGIWEDKRSKGLIKFKGELEADFEVIGWEEGTGKNTGRMGALTIASSDRQIVCNVGTGFSDEQRDKYTKEYMVGKIVSIKYNAKVQDKKGSVGKLFLPVFIEERLDKSEADHSKNIK